MAFELEKIAQSLDGSEASGFEMERIAAAVGEGGGSSGGSGEIFIVHGTCALQGDRSFTPDKSMKEIGDAIAAGKACFLVVSVMQDTSLMQSFTAPITSNTGVYEASVITTDTLNTWKFISDSSPVTYTSKTISFA